MKALLAPLIVCSVVFVAFDLSLGVGRFSVGDFAVCLFFSYILFQVSKDNLFYVVNVFFLVLIFYVVNRVKLQYFGAPVTASDLLSVIALYDVQNAAVKSLTLAMLGLFLFGLVLNLNYTRNNVLVLVLCFVALPAGYVFALSGWVCDEKGCESLPEEGGASLNYFAYSLAELKYELFGAPSADEVHAAAALLPGDQWLYRHSAMDIADKRNIYMILVESLWDPVALQGASYSVDPFDDEFRALWESGARSAALSPVFGGGTANAEFELLCGLPVTSSVIKFELPVLNDALPCLPRYLDSQGYATVASHPNIEGFWNRDAAYPKLGFRYYYDIDDFVGDDLLSGVYLSDGSLYAQTERRLGKTDVPLFSYVLTASQHYPYVDLGERAEPTVNGVDNSYFSRYVKLIHRGSRELYQYYQWIRRTDHDAIIVMLGDHLPLFGRNFTVYKEGGLFSGIDAEAPNRVQAMYRVPLVVIDGDKGALNVGTIGMYEIPALVVRLLQRSSPSGSAGHVTRSGTTYRPLSNGAMLYADGAWALCERGALDEPCRKPLQVHAAMNTVVRDITIGERFSLGSAAKRQ